MNKNIAVLPGDGVGPEVIKQAIKILDKIAIKFRHIFEYKYGLIGACAIEKTGNPLPSETLKICKDADAVLFGAIGDPKYDNDPKAKIRPEQGLLKLRKSLGLYANLRPVKIYNNLSDISPLKKEKILNVDMIVIRELIGGIYFGLPRERKDKNYTAVDTSVYTKNQIKIVTEYAFNLAIGRRKLITSVDKANVLETSRLWRETVNEVSKKYPQIQLNHMFVDNASMQIIKNPSQFDIILTENMFGDILSDEASSLIGSIGLIPSASIGEKISLYEPIHGAYNKAAGKNTADPIATILSAAMMLEISFGMIKEAKRIESAVEETLDEGYRTKDIADINTKPENILGTKELGEQISKRV
jgi:3-isopropylmalate dehydrogenase